MYNVTSGHCPAGTIEKVNCWPMPEVNNNIDMTTGDLGFTDREEDQIVAFLETLTDGFTRPYPDRDKFTGVCMTCDPSKDPNCSPSRQGNGSLIPTPPLPPLRIRHLRCGACPQTAYSDEWQYYATGKGRMTVFAAGSTARTMDFEEGDVG
jgi:hypothetical protein